MAEFERLISELPEVGDGLRAGTGNLNPQLALELLDLARPNRKPRGSLVRDLAREMKAGLWQLTSQPIVIDSERKLADGQHRCKAVIVSGVTIRVLFAFGDPPAAFAAYDAGRSRSGADVLYLKGEKYEKSLASALGLVARYDEGSFIPTNPERVSLLDRYPEIRRSVDLCETAGTEGLPGIKSIMTPGHLAYVHWRGAQVVGDSTADAFVEKIATGTHSSPYDPTWVLRERLRDYRTAGGPRGSAKKFTTHAVLALCVKAFNAFALGEETRRLIFGPREEFPKFVTVEDVRKAEEKRGRTREPPRSSASADPASATA